MTLDQKALAAALLPILAKGIQHNFPSLPYRAAKTAAEDILPAIVAALSTQDVAPAECSCDDPDCPRRHEPLTLRQAYENALVRLRKAESVASLPAPEPVAWECYRPGAGSENSLTTLTRWKRDADAAKNSGAEVRPLVYASPPSHQGLREALAKIVAEGESFDSSRVILDRVLAFARAALQSQPAPSGETNGWQPIETAPKDGTRILALFPRENSDRVDIVTWFDGASKRPYWRSGVMEMVNGVRGMRAEQPTHWMPLPAPPAQPLLKKGK